MRPITLTPQSPGYPRRLARFGARQAPLFVSAPLGDPPITVAIAGTRHPDAGARGFAFELAKALASEGVTILSGGATGIDTAAHLGALEVGGTTWCVSPSSPGAPFPPENIALFRRLEESPPSAMVWPFPEGRFEAVKARARNKVMVALADAVVVVQARIGSGSQNTMTCARDLDVPLWVVPSAPWMVRHRGGLQVLRGGAARPLWDMGDLFVTLGLRAPPPTTDELPPEEKRRPPERRREASAPLFPDPLGTEETVVISALSATPTHVDAIVDGTGLSIPAVRSALLTLTMKNVVVEGPDGFFRRQMEG